MKNVPAENRSGENEQSGVPVQLKFLLGALICAIALVIAKVAGLI